MFAIFACFTYLQVYEVFFQLSAKQQWRAVSAAVLLSNCTTFKLDGTIIWFVAQKLKVPALQARRNFFRQYFFHFYSASLG